MNKQEKQSVILELKNDFAQNQAAFVVGIKGLNVFQMQAIRRGVRQQGGKMLLAKNSLMEIASREIAGAQDLAPYFKEQVALVFSRNEPAAVAKVLMSIAQEQELLKLIVASVDARLIGPDVIGVLAKLPSREALLSQLCGTLNAPLVAYVTVLNQLIARLVYVLKDVSEKKAV